MGFYECILDCGDGCHCVSIESSLDNFVSTSYIFCDKHKPEKGKKLQYNLNQFLYQNTKKNITLIKNVEILNKNYKFIKLKVFDFNINDYNLQEKNQIFITDFDCEPNFVQDGEHAIIIDKYYDGNIHINSSSYTGSDLIFDWERNKVIPAPPRDLSIEEKYKIHFDNIKNENKDITHEQLKNKIYEHFIFNIRKKRIQDNDIFKISNIIFDYILDLEIANK